MWNLFLLFSSSVESPVFIYKEEHVNIYFCGGQERCVYEPFSLCFPLNFVHVHCKYCLPISSYNHDNVEIIHKLNQPVFYVYLSESGESVIIRQSQAKLDRKAVYTVSGGVCSLIVLHCVHLDDYHS